MNIVHTKTSQHKVVSVSTLSEEAQMALALRLSREEPSTAQHVSTLSEENQMALALRLSLETATTAQHVSTYQKKLNWH